MLHAWHARTLIGLSFGLFLSACEDANAISERIDNISSIDAGAPTHAGFDRAVAVEPEPEVDPSGPRAMGPSVVIPERADAGSSPDVIKVPAPCDDAPHGTEQTRVRFAQAFVAASGTCVSETQQRVCNDGAWSAYSGTFGAERCAPCSDADGDGYGLNCPQGNDCDETEPAIHAGADEQPWDLIDSNCDGKVGKHLEHVTRLPKAPHGIMHRLLDNGLLVDLGYRITVSKLGDAAHPIFDAPYANTPPTFATLHDGTLVVAAGYRSPLVIYDLSDPRVGAIERARISPVPYPLFALSEDGKRLFLRKESPDIVVYDLSDRSQPVVVSTITTSCSTNEIASVGDVLVLARCNSSTPTAAHFSEAHDVSDPARPRLIARWTDLKDDVYLGTDGSDFYFKKANLVRRYARPEDGTQSFGEAESLTVPSSPDFNAVGFGFSRSGVVYSETVDTGLAQRLCAIASDSVEPECWPGLVPAAEILATGATNIDGTDVLLHGGSFTRLVDLKARTAPVLGERWLRVIPSKAISIDDARLVVSTFAGVAVFDPATLQVRDFVPIATSGLAGICAAADGNLVMALTSEGVVHSLDINPDGSLHLSQRTHLRKAGGSACLLARRGKKLYFVALAGATPYSYELAADGTLGPAVALSDESCAGLVDNGERLFTLIKEDEGETVIEIDVNGATPTDPIRVGVSRMAFPMLATRQWLYFRDEEFQQIRLSTGKQRSILGLGGALGLCQNARDAFAINQTPFLLRDGRTIAAAVKGAPDKSSWNYCAAGGDFLLLDGSNYLDSVRIVAE